MQDDSDAQGRFSVAVDLGDPDLSEQVFAALDAHPRLYAVAFDEAADVLVTDRIEQATEEIEGQVLTVADNADATLPGPADPHLVVSAAHLIAAGHTVENALTRVPHDDAMLTDADLSPRETDVVTLLVEGASNKHIARALGISERTAKFHVAAVTRKLAARNRSEAVAIALRHGLVAL